MSRLLVNLFIYSNKLCNISLNYHIHINRQLLHLCCTVNLVIVFYTRMYIHPTQDSSPVSSLQVTLVAIFFPEVNIKSCVKLYNLSPINFFQSIKRYHICRSYSFSWMTTSVFNPITKYHRYMVIKLLVCFLISICY